MSGDGVTLTPDTVLFLRELLYRQQLAVGAEDFPVAARQILAVLAELDAALAAPPEPTTATE